MERNIVNIEKSLEQKKVIYELIKHTKNIHSAKEGAEYFGIDVGQTAPSIIISADGKLYALIISGSRNKVDFDNLKDLLNAESIEMASKDIIRDKLGFRAGNIPMISLPVPCIIDKELFKFNFVYGGTGIMNVTIKVNPLDLQVLNEECIVISEL
jgi:prolyl-tRNA editing enzyme YbaK/EbsC (Cys-tRNA(Pro) deacylase)